RARVASPVRGIVPAVTDVEGRRVAFADGGERNVQKEQSRRSDRHGLGLPQSDESNEAAHHDRVSRSMETVSKRPSESRTSGRDSGITAPFAEAMRGGSGAESGEHGGAGQRVAEYLRFGCCACGSGGSVRLAAAAASGLSDGPRVPTYGRRSHAVPNFAFRRFALPEAAESR